MTQDTLTGDELLAQDAQYVRSSTAMSYYAFPSAALPRFLVPAGDRAGLVFLLRMMSVDKGLGGSILRASLRIPGVPGLLRAFLFEKVVI